MTPGAILDYKQFTFHDGAQADKLLIVLNAGGQKPYLIVKTTSQAKPWREAKDGCNASKSYYFLPANRECFKKPTWILLHEYYEFTSTKLIQAHFDGSAKIAHTCKTELLRAIINCARKTLDWAPHYDDLLK